MLGAAWFTTSGDVQDRVFSAWQPKVGAQLCEHSGFRPAEFIDVASSRQLRISIHLSDEMRAILCEGTWEVLGIGHLLSTANDGVSVSFVEDGMVVVISPLEW